MADERELQQQRLEAELAECVMSSSWFYCVAGVALAVPLGVRRKVRGRGGGVWMGRGMAGCEMQRPRASERIFEGHLPQPPPSVDQIC